MLQRYKIHHLTSPVLIFRSNQGQQYDVNPFTPICFFTHTQYTYSYMSLPPFLSTFLGCYKMSSYPSTHTALQSALFT